MAVPAPPDAGCRPSRRPGARSPSRAPGRCRASPTCRTTPTSRCRSRVCRRTSRRQPDGRLRADLRPARRWAGRRIVLHVGAAESVLIARLNDREVGISKDSHLAAEFDVTEPRPAGREHAPPARGQVVRRDLRRGPGPVVARRDHPVGLPVRHGPGPPRRHPGRRRPGGRPVDRDPRPDRRGRLPGRRARAGLDGRGPPGDARRAARRGGPGRRPAGGDGLDPGRPAAVRSRGRPGRASAQESDDWAAVHRRLAPPRDGLVTWHVELPDVAAGRPRSPSCTG